MLFYGLSPEQVRCLGHNNGKYYAFELGERVEITCTKRANSNVILSGSLSSNKIEDKFMIKYYPSNTLYFDAELIENAEDFSSVSCSIDRNTCSVYIGVSTKYEIRQGVLTLSGAISANGLIQRQRAFLSNSQLGGRIKEKVRILSVGILGDNLVGLFLSQRERGIAVSIDDSDVVALSTKTLQLRPCDGWGKYFIDDWFDKCKIAPFRKGLSGEGSSIHRAVSSETPKDLSSLLSMLNAEDAVEKSTGVSHEASSNDSEEDEEFGTGFNSELNFGLGFGDDFGYPMASSCTEQDISRKRREELAKFGELRLAVLL